MPTTKLKQPKEIADLPDTPQPPQNNNQQGKRIAKNAGVLMASQLLTWGLAILVTVYVPRYLGREGIGILGLAESIWAIMSTFISFGMDVFLAKEIARKPERIGEFFGTQIVTRLGLMVLFYGIAFGYAQLRDFPDIVVSVIMIFGIVELFAQMARICRASLQGLEEMQFISLADIVSKALTTILSLTVLILGFGVTAIAFVAIVGGLTSFLVQLWPLRRNRRLPLSFDASLAVRMLRDSIPYLLSIVLLTVYTNIDIQMLEYLTDIETVGLYNVSVRLFGTFLFVPNVFVTAVFPAISRMYADDENGLPKLLGKSYDLLMMLSIPIGFGVLAVARPVLYLLYEDEFIDSTPILAGFGLVLILTYLNTLMGKFLIATDRQNNWTILMAVGVIITVPLDLILIPYFAEGYGNGGIGGVVAFGVTEGVMLVAGHWLLPKGSLGRANAWVAIRCLVAGSLMVAMVWLVRDWFVAFQIAAGGVVYVVLILLMRVIPPEDMAIGKEYSLLAINKVRERFAKPA